MPTVSDNAESRWGSEGVFGNSVQTLVNFKGVVLVATLGQNPDQSGRRSKRKVKKQRQQVSTLLLRISMVDEMNNKGQKLGKG